MKNPLLICSLAMVLASPAQNINIIKGQEFTVPKNLWIRPIDPDETGAYTLFSKAGWNDEPYTLQKTDLKTGKILYAKPMSFKGAAYSEVDNRGDFVEAINTGDRLLLFGKGQKGKRHVLVLHQFDPKTGEQIAEPKAIDEINDNKAAVISFNFLNFEISISPDKSKLLVVSEWKADEKIQKVQAKIYDAKSLIVIATKEPASVYEKSTVSTYNYMVDNNGNMAYSFVYLVDELTKNWAIGVNPAGANQNKVYALRGGDKDKIEMYNSFDLASLNGNFIFTGSYLEKKEKDTYTGSKDNKQGLFFFAIDPATVSFKAENYELFNPTVQQQLATDGEKGPYRAFEAVKTIYNNGNYYVIRTRNEDEKKHLKEILVTKYNSAFKMEWQRLIPRSAAEGEDRINYMVTPKTICLFYMENPENLSLTDLGSYNAKDYKKTKSSGAALICSSIDEKGQVSRRKFDVDPNTIINKRFELVYAEQVNALLIRNYIKDATLIKQDVITVAD